MDPLVTIVALCYNHGPYLQEALRSISQQTYQNIEVIVLDDGSTDYAPSLFPQLKSEYPKWRFLRHDFNQGNCKSFNECLPLAQGKYVIDFATDDIMMEHRVASQVEFFESFGEGVGVIHSDAWIVNQQNVPKYRHSDVVKNISSGYVYLDLLSRYMICPPTMMYRKSMLDAIGGYNTDLPFEDFDLWMRTAKLWQYHYQAQVLMRYRRIPNSLSHRAVENEEMQFAIAGICERELANLNSKKELAAMRSRLNIQLREAHRGGVMTAVEEYHRLLKKCGGPDWKSRMLLTFSS